MIDTDKYEGHTEGPWDWFPKTNDSHIGHLERHSNLTRVTAEIKSRSAENDANAQLIADAPLLLAEVKRLRRAWQILRSKTEMSCVCFTEYPDNQDINTHELMDWAMKEATE